MEKRIINKVHKSENLSGDTLVLDFTEKDKPKIYFKKQETILLCQGIKEGIMIEKKII